MRINPVAYNHSISNNIFQKTSLIKPMENDSVHFSGKTHKKEKKDSASSPIFLKLGQKRAPKLEEAAKEILKDAQEAIGFSYIGDYMKNTRQVITDGYEILPTEKTIAQTYTFEEGALVEAELGVREDNATGSKTTEQIFKFQDGKLLEVLEKVSTDKDGNTTFQKQYKADENGKLKCTYNKVW